MAARSACPNPLAVRGRSIWSDPDGIELDPSWAVVLNGVISGGTLIKQDLGTLVLNGANTYASTVITGGTVLGNSTSIRGNVDFQPAQTEGALRWCSNKHGRDVRRRYPGARRASSRRGAGVAHPNRREQLFRRHHGSGRNPHWHVEKPTRRHREQRCGGLRPARRRDLCRQSDGLRHADQERRRPPLDHGTRSGRRRHDHQRRDARGERHADQQRHRQQGRDARRQQ